MPSAGEADHAGDAGPRAHEDARHGGGGVTGGTAQEHVPREAGALAGSPQCGEQMGLLVDRDVQEGGAWPSEAP